MRRRPTIGSRVRRHRGGLGWMGFCAFLWGVALPALGTNHVADPDEAAFQLVGASGDPAGVEKPPSSDAPPHCVFCHWQRAVSGALVPEPARSASPGTFRLIAQRLACSLPTASFYPHSSRAPPLHASL